MKKRSGEFLDGPGRFFVMLEVFRGRLFGLRYERLKRTLPVWLVLFWGLKTSGLTLPLTPSVLNLTVFIVTVGAMQQSLASENNRRQLQNIFMLPLWHKSFVAAYISSLGVYVFLTRTAGILAVALALGDFTGEEILASLLCAADGILMTAWGYGGRTRPLPQRLASGFWGLIFILSVSMGGGQAWLAAAAAANGVLAFLLVRRMNPYSFWPEEGEKGRKKSFLQSSLKRNLRQNRRSRGVFCYLFRYLFSHKNYLVNTAALWGVACVLPLLGGRDYNPLAVPLGCAILTLNTPVCILLSCDPALERAVRFLPGQRRAFCLPYCLFLFGCNMTADVIYLISLELQNGDVTGLTVLTAFCFAMQSAVCSVLLEWYYPVRGWKLESDLWHHPRKYLVPGLMVIFAGAVGMVPWLTGLWLIFLGGELLWLFLV